MSGNSRRVSSNQDGPHPGLAELWDRRRDAPFNAPLHPASIAALEAIHRQLRLSDSLVLDSGCGTGASTARLAAMHPDALVVGIDKSGHRLARSDSLPDNAILVRADVVTAWRWMNQQDLTVQQHYLLYPNPWPKAAHLARRWQGHPVFPELLRLSRHIEVRTNWLIYAQEFARAAKIFQCRVTGPERIRPTQALTPFEKKYQASGHELFRLSVRPDCESDGRM